MAEKESERISLIPFKYKTAGLSLTFPLYLLDPLKDLLQVSPKAFKSQLMFLV